MNSWFRSYYSPRANPRTLSFAALIGVGAWCIVMAAGFFMLFFGNQRLSITRGVWNIVFLFFWLLVIFWPAIVSTACSYYFSLKRIWGPGWWKIAAGSFPVALFSYWPIWHPGGRMQPESG